MTPFITIPFYRAGNNVLSTIFFMAMLITFAGCTHKKKVKESYVMPPIAFNVDTLQIGKQFDVKKVRGQLVYMPIYSNVPYYDAHLRFDLSAFVAIHNTDLHHPIKLTKVLFFNNNGDLVANYLTNDTLIHALGAGNFFIPERDQSGTGANFLIEWTADTLVNEPLIESVMLGLTGGQGLSFLSQGKVIREIQ
jgi:hypothetical protein